MLHTRTRPSIVRIGGALAFAVMSTGLLVHLAASNRPAGPQASGGDAATTDRIAVEVGLIGTPLEEATGKVRTMTTSLVRAGDRRTDFIFADTYRNGELCQFAVGPEDSSDVGVRWKVEFQLLEATAARATIAVAWSRAGWRAGEFAEQASGSHTVRLDLGQHQVLDYLANPDSKVCSNVMLQLTAKAEPVREPQQNVVFDLWLEYQGRLGHRWEHTRVTARSGVQAPFKFEDMGWAVGEDSAGAGPGPFLLRVAGTVLGRLRADGFVDIALRARRDLAWASGSAGGNGDLDYRAALGEAAEVLLPPVTGSSREPYPTAPATATPGLSYQDGMWVLDIKRFLDGQVRLYVSATRQP